MSERKNLSTNLYLDNLPNINGEDTEKIFSEFTRIYNAMNTLAIKIDEYTGVGTRTFDEIQQLGTQQQNQTGANMHRVYLPYSMDCTKGKLLVVNGSNEWALHSGTHPVTAMCAEDSVVAGQVGAAILWGVITLPFAITPGANYNATGGGNMAVGGYISGNAVTSPSFPPPANFYVQSVGIGLTDNQFLFTLRGYG